MNDKNNFLKGATLLTITMLLSKILGFAYIIPFTKMVGTEGYILFEYAYKPYAIMISIATMGIPMAVSKFISKYNELGDFDTGRRLFKSGIVILTITGFMWAAILFACAPLITSWLIDETQTTGNNSKDVIFVIRTVSFALIVVPVMAMVRGYFQGHQKMKPTAISQVVEQLVRITIILLGSFIVINYGSGKISDAVGISTFAAFLAAIGSMFILMWYWKLYKKELKTPNTIDVTRESPSLIKIYKELFFSSIPFVIVSLAIPVYQNIDIFSINATLIKQGINQEQAEFVNGMVAIVQKVVTIPIIFANAFALTLIPAITKSYIGKNKETLHSQISKTFQVILFFTVPFSAIFFVLPQETFGVLLGTENAIYGGEITRAYALIALFFSLFIVTTSILQGINKQYFAVVGLFVGLVMKFILSVPFITIFSGAGTAYSTMVGFGISIIFNLYIIKKFASFSFKLVFKQSLVICFISIVTLLILVASRKMVYMFIPLQLNEYLSSLITLTICSIIGATFYLLISYKAGMLHIVFGDKMNKIKKKKEA